MSKYELDIPDNEIDSFLDDLRGGLGGKRAQAIADVLEGQKPGLPVPTKHGAVVRSQDGTVWLLGDCRSTRYQWIRTMPEGGFEWVDEPGPISEILFEGF